MVNRIRAFMAYTCLSASDFAKKASLSLDELNTLLNNPSEADAELLAAILRAWPDLSAEWVIRGIPPMLKSETIALLNQQIKQLETKQK